MNVRCRHSEFEWAQRQRWWQPQQWHSRSTRENFQFGQTEILAENISWQQLKQFGTRRNDYGSDEKKCRRRAENKTKKTKKSSTSFRKKRRWNESTTNRQIVTHALALAHQGEKLWIKSRHSKLNHYLHLSTQNAKQHSSVFGPVALARTFYGQIKGDFFHSFLVVNRVDLTSVNGKKNSKRRRVKKKEKEEMMRRERDNINKQ